MACRPPTSPDVGLLVGGAQHTVAATRRPVSCCPSPRRPRWKARQARAVKGREGTVAGAVAGEDAPGAVSAVGGQNESDHEDTSVGGTEGGYGPVPAGLVREGGASAGGGDLLASGDEPGAGAAHADHRVEVVQDPGRSGQPCRACGGAGDARARVGGVASANRSRAALASRRAGRSAGGVAHGPILARPKGSTASRMPRGSRVRPAPASASLTVLSTAGIPLRDSTRRRRTAPSP